ncbi:MAG: restriction endonuclease subunit S [Bacteroidales bacterium]|nr:restriction endonuclease subunit S [Bacteroidales bacterium]
MKTSYKLKDVATVLMGYNARTQVEESEEGSTDLLQMKDLTSEVLDKMPALTRFELETRSTRFLIQAGDIVIRTRGKSFGCTYIQSEPERPTVPAAPLMIIRVNEGAPVQPAYLSWLLNQPGCQSVLQHAAKKSTAIPMINGQTIADLDLLVHPFEEQAAIAQIANLSLELKQLSCELAEKKHQLIIATLN